MFIRYFYPNLVVLKSTLCIGLHVSNFPSGLVLAKIKKTKWLLNYDGGKLYKSGVAYHVGMNEIEVLVLVLMAMYIMNRLYAMKQNIYPHDAMQPILMVQPIAIAFLHILHVNPIILFVHIQRRSAAIGKKKYKKNIY